METKMGIESMKYAINLSAQMARLAKSQKNLELAFEDFQKSIQNSNIPYALCGGLALSYYGLIRGTEDIDILVKNQEDANSLHKMIKNKFRQLDDRYKHKNGYADLDIIQPGRLVPQGVINKAIDNAVIIDGLRIVALQDLIILKLYANRHRDIDDIQRLIKLHPDIKIDFPSVEIEQRFVEIVNELR